MRFRSASTSFQSVRHASRSSAGNNSRDLRSRSPASAGSTRQVISFATSASSVAALSPILLSHAARSAQPLSCLVAPVASFFRTHPLTIRAGSATSQCRGTRSAVPATSLQVVCQTWIVGKGRGIQPGHGDAQVLELTDPHQSQPLVIVLWLIASLQEGRKVGQDQRFGFAAEDMPDHEIALIRQLHAPVESPDCCRQGSAPVCV